MLPAQAQAQQALKATGDEPSTAPDTVEANDEGGRAYIGPGGRVESELEYNARIAHNTYMRFYTTFQRTVAANRSVNSSRV